MAKKHISNEELQAEAVNIIKTEKEEWETGTVYVTEKVSFQMRDLIRTLRKNYWGIFDSPTDPVSGRKKIWTHLTKSVCDGVVKNIDLDTKDFNVRATKPDAINLASLIRGITKDKLDKIYFGETLDMIERNLAIDGTVVVKVFKDDKEKCFRIKIVDLLNLYIDPTAESVHDTPIIERVVMPVHELKSQKDWINTDDVEGTTDVNPNDGMIGNLGMNSRGNTKYAEVFERWGTIPKRLITGKTDDDEQIEGRIVASYAGGQWFVHKIEENDEVRPYEAAWFKKLPGRFYGEGVAEMIMWEQLYVNIVRNIRINRSYVSQLGLFKIRRGSGVTPQMLARLSTNGGIQVDSMDDIQQLVMQEASQSSYLDENNSRDWARQVSGAFETVTGETMPSSTTATTAAIQSRSAMSQFVLVKEQIGMFLQRLFNRHAMPIMLSYINKGDIMRYADDGEHMEQITRKIVRNKLLNNGIYDEDRIEREIEKMRKSDYLFFKVSEKFDPEDFDVQIFFTNEEIDKNVLVNNLIQAIPLAPEFREQMIRHLFDILGLSFVTNANKQASPSLPQQSTPTNIPVKSGQQIVTDANTLNSQMAPTI